SPFQTATAAEASLFSDMLRLRFDQQLTAKALIERSGATKLAANERRALRRALLSCRSCLDSDLVATVLNAATCLLGQQPSAEGAGERSEERRVGKERRAWWRRGSRRRHTRFSRDWSSDVCSSDLAIDRRGTD